MLTVFKTLLAKWLCGEAWIPESQDIIFSVDKNDLIKGVSQSAQGFFGKDYKKLKGQKLIDFIAVEDRNRLIGLLHQVRAAAHGEAIVDGAVQDKIMLTTPSSSPQVFEVRVQAFKHGNIQLLMMRQGSDRAMHQDKTIRLQQAHGPMQLQGVNTDMLADLSHEMKTPLNAILGFADTMQEETFGKLGHERYREYVKHIHTSGTHLMGLVSSILDMARLDAARYELKPTLGNVASIARESAEMLRDQIEAAGLDLVVDGDADIVDSMIDHQAVRQILLNLLSNAIKFTSDGEIRIIIRQYNDEFSICVHDTGIGMNESELAALGARFTTAQGDGVRGASGTGLGLSLASSLATLHGGGLMIESAPGEGVVATLRLPVVVPSVPEKSSPNTPVSKSYYVIDNNVEMPEVMPAGRPQVLQTQLERIEDYRRKMDAKRKADAA